MIGLGLIAAALAALVHVFIFYLESIAWESDRARTLFGTGSVEEARATKFLAYNQGFYNLILAVLAIVGVALAIFGSTNTGITLVLAGVGSMLAAALVLFLSSRPHRGAAIKQGALPLIAVLGLTIGLLT